MSRGWSPNDKSIAKTAAERARRRAEQEALRLHKECRIDTIDDLWALELQIREWHKERRYFTFSYEDATEQLAKWLARGWLLESDLARMSPERVDEIKARVNA